MLRPSCILAACLLALTACGGGSGAHGATRGAANSPARAASATTVDSAALGRRYLAIAAPANAAIDTFNEAVHALPPSATGSDIARLAEPVISAVRTADEALLRAAWPASVKTHIDELVAAQAVLLAELANAANQSGPTMSQWLDQLTRDAGKVSGAASILRADLGLPPPSH